MICCLIQIFYQEQVIPLPIQISRMRFHSLMITSQFVPLCKINNSIYVVIQNKTTFHETYRASPIHQCPIHPYCRCEKQCLMRNHPMNYKEDSPSLRNLYVGYYSIILDAFCTCLSLPAYIRASYNVHFDDHVLLVFAQVSYLHTVVYPLHALF